MSQSTNNPSDTEIKGIGAQAGQLDPDKELTLEELEQINFAAKKPEHLKKLDAEFAALAAKPLIPTDNPLANLYALLYKHMGPLELVLFYSKRPLPTTIRDAKIWCERHGFRYVKAYKALVDVLRMDQELIGNLAPAGDITDIVTRQSRPGGPAIKEVVDNS